MNSILRKFPSSLCVHQIVRKILKIKENLIKTAKLAVGFALSFLFCVFQIAVLYSN